MTFWKIAGLSCMAGWSKGTPERAVGAGRVSLAGSEGPRQARPVAASKASSASPGVS
jgi:hypothetical protein